MWSEFLLFASAFCFGVTVCVWLIFTLAARQAGMYDEVTFVLRVLITLIPLSLTVGLFILGQSRLL